MIDVNGDLAERLNSEKLKKAQGIYSFPTNVPQFKDGGPVGMKQRLVESMPNLASQSKQLRYNVQNPPGKTYVQPQSGGVRTVDVGPMSDYRFPPPNGVNLSPNVVDSQMVEQTAANIAQNYNGPYKDKVQAMFPQPSGMSRPGSLAQSVLGYKDGGEVEQDEYGMIQGPGTGTSDDIPATLEEGDYIIPAAAVEKFGADNLMRLIHAVMGEEMMEGDMESGEPVQAMVSNGEIRVPSEVVEKLGAGFFDAIKSAANVNSTDKTKDGKPAYATMGYVDEEKKKVDQSFNNRIAGIPNLAGAVNKFNDFFATSEATGNRGDQRPPGYASSLNNTQAPNYGVNPIKQGLSVAGDYTNKAVSYLSNAFDKTPTPEIQKPNLGNQDLIRNLQQQAAQNSNPISQRTEQPQPRTPANTNDSPYAVTVPTLYWGEQEFTGKNPQLDRDIYDRQRQRLDYQDQRDFSTVPQESEFTRGKNGISSSVRVGGFTPQVRSQGRGDNSLDMARLEEDKRQFDITQGVSQQKSANKQRLAQLFDVYQNDQDENRRVTALKYIQQLDPEFYIDLVKNNGI